MFMRCFTTGVAFECWRNIPHDYAGDTSWLRIIDYRGNVDWLNIPIICTISGFVYDKIVERHGLPLLRERKVFTFDINDAPKL